MTELLEQTRRDIRAKAANWTDDGLRRALAETVEFLMQAPPGPSRGYEAACAQAFSEIAAERGIDVAQAIEAARQAWMGQWTEVVDLIAR